MGAGKSTLGWEVAQRLGRRLVDLDHELARTAR
ncbi:MAG: shikimate kinase, partial [Gaiellaceae bacterium]